MERLGKIWDEILKFCRKMRWMVGGCFPYSGRVRYCLRVTFALSCVYVLAGAAVFVSALAGYFLSFYLLAAMTLGWMAFMAYVGWTDHKKNRSEEILVLIFWIVPVFNAVMWLAYYFATGQTRVGLIGTFLKNTLLHFLFR